MTNDVNTPGKWQADYERGTDGWDLGGPTPAFQHLASGKQIPPGRMIVLGAGRGYDAREFARNDFQVTAVDFAPHVIREMYRLANPLAPVDIIQSDIFALPQSLNSSFDYVLEYTCFCAIDPARRGDYVDLVARLLKPNGLLIHLAFPLDAHKGGPPFAVSISELLTLFPSRGFGLISQKVPSNSVPRRRGLEELLIFRREDSSSPM